MHDCTFPKRVSTVHCIICQDSAHAPADVYIRELSCCSDLEATIALRSLVHYISLENARAAHYTFLTSNEVVSRCLISLGALQAENDQPKPVKGGVDVVYMLKISDFWHNVKRL